MLTAGGSAVATYIYIYICPIHSTGHGGRGGFSPLICHDSMGSLSLCDNEAEGSRDSKTDQLEDFRYIISC